MAADAWPPRASRVRNPAFDVTPAPLCHRHRLRAGRGASAVSREPARSGRDEGPRAGLVRLLAIETSCDETAAAVVEDGRRILSNVVSTQIRDPCALRGRRPELASRHHLENIVSGDQKAMADAATRVLRAGRRGRDPRPGLDRLAARGGAGRQGHRLRARQAPGARAPHRGTHPGALPRAHRPQIPLPAVALVVSGGHTSLYEVPEEGATGSLGRTRDDAAGEAFDKVAKLLGLGYPGGPVIDRLSQGANDRAIDFTVARIKDGAATSPSAGSRPRCSCHVRRHGIPPVAAPRRRVPTRSAISWPPSSGPWSRRCCAASSAAAQARGPAACSSPAAWRPTPCCARGRAHGGERSACRSSSLP